MRFEERTFDVEAAVAAGDWLDTEDLEDMVVQLEPGLTGTFSNATLQLQGTQNGTTPVNIGTAATASAYISLAGQRWKRLRINTTAYAFGAPVALLGAANSRTS